MSEQHIQLTNAHRLLAEQLTAIERCGFFLYAAISEISQPLTADYLSQHSLDAKIFNQLATINERFAKLQDILGASFRHAALLAGKPNHDMLKVLGDLEKIGVIPSTTFWQEIRLLRNSADHDYEIDFSIIAEHFNEVKLKSIDLLLSAMKYIDYCQSSFSVNPLDETIDRLFKEALRKFEP
jgi:hypothetical protein